MEQNIADIRAIDINSKTIVMAQLMADFPNVLQGRIKYLCDTNSINLIKRRL